MFDSVTHPSVRGRVGTGAVLSVVLHGLALAAALLISAHSEKPEPAFPILHFVVPRAPALATPAPAAPAAQARPRVAHRHPVAVHPDAVVGKAMNPPDVASVDSTDDAPDLDVPDSVGGGGIAGQVTGSTTIGVPGVGSGPSVFSLEEGMTMPKRISGPTPSYTREALEAGVEGTILARCVITADGRVTHCRILKGLPHLDRSVIGALEGQRYTPVTLNGKPIAVDYLFTLRMVLPGH